MKRPASSPGFTIVEVMIVLVIAAVIMLIIFLAVPALQRVNRNTRRDQDAAHLNNAIAECMVNSQKNSTKCDSPSEIEPYMSPLGVFTGYHYGRKSDGSSDSPTLDEPNWLFSLRCTTDLKWFVLDQPPTVYVVTYYREDGNGLPVSRCLDGG